MIKVSLIDGSYREYEAGISAAQVAKNLGIGLYKAACAVKIDGVAADLRTALDKDCHLEISTFESHEGKHAFWHSGSHVLAQAVMRLYPEAKIAIGPAIENGFYYDFDIQPPFDNEDLEKIEKEMKKIVSEGLPILRKEISADEARELFADQPYKLELLEKHAAAGEIISVYTQGDFADLCAGPHLMDTSPLKAIKLLSTTGAYWHGDSNLAMLCRVYGTAYPKNSQLEEYLRKLEEAKKRDHNILGRQLEYFTTSEVIGQGLPILLPNGAKVVQLLQRWVEDEEEKRGYLITKTPYMAKSDLYKISGHWDHYYDNMFVIGDKEMDERGEEVMALRPMTCPFQFQAYLNRLRSYRDLPLRYSETSTLFRNEASGEMHGLIRLRQFTISEGHLACRPDQVAEEFKGCVELADMMLSTLGLREDVTFRFSKWDENDKDKYIGEKETWESAQNFMREVLDGLGLDYVEADGEAAFYGPKLDIQLKNVYGKEDTLITVQIDFQLAEKFGMTYTDADGQKKHPIVIHRTSVGCYERTLAMLIEKYAGAMPTWLAPVQVMIVPISENHHDYARILLERLQKSGIRAKADFRNEKMNYKIREAQLAKIPYMLVAGDKEAAENTVSVRARKEGKGGVKGIDAFIADIITEIASKEY